MLQQAGLDPRKDGAYIAAAPVSPPGCRSEYEYAELSLATPVVSTTLLARLANAVEAGLRLLSLVRMPPWSPEIRTALRARCYEMTCPSVVSGKVDTFLAATHWPWTRWKKGQIRELDIRPAVTEIICLSGRVRFALECSDIAPKPAEVIASIFGLPLVECQLLPITCTGIRMNRQTAYLGYS